MIYLRPHDIMGTYLKGITMAPVDNLKNKIADAIKLAEEDNISGFKDANADVYSYAEILSQQINQGMPESYNLISLQMNTLKYVIFTLLVATLAMLVFFIPTVLYVENSFMSYIIMGIVGATYLKYLWTKSTEYSTLYKDFIIIARHNQDICSSIAGEIDALQYIRNYEIIVMPKIEEWKKAGKWEDTE